MIQNLAPVQFNFFNWWTHDLGQMQLPANVEAAFQALKSYYEDIAEQAYEETVENGFIAKASSEYELALHTALVKYKDIHWLRKTFCGCTLADLSLAIAQALDPKESWEILENDELAVVTNQNRTIVFDLKHFDVLSASASLALVKDPLLIMNETITQEVNRFYQSRLDNENRRLLLLKQILEKNSNDAQVIPLHGVPDKNI